MRNITVSVDEETHRMARIRAAELDTSVSALVRDYLRALGQEDSSQEETVSYEGRPEDAAPDAAVRRHVKQLHAEARARAEALTGRPVRDNRELVEVRRRKLDEVLADFDARGIGLDMSENLSLEELYDRDRARADAELGRKRNSSD